MSSKFDEHEEEIVTMRRARATWSRIAASLKARGVKISDGSEVRKWFLHARARAVRAEKETAPFVSVQLSPSLAPAVAPSIPPADAPRKRVIPPFKKKEKTPEEIENEKAWSEIDTSKMPG